MSVFIRSALNRAAGVYSSAIWRITTVVFSLAMMELGSLVSMPLPFTPIPVTMAPQVSILLAIFLGARSAVGVLILYFFASTIGLAHFALGKTGMALLCGPTAGYFLGYLLSALLVGWLVPKRFPAAPVPFVSFMLFLFGIGGLVIKLVGSAYLAIWSHSYSAFALGFFPFFLADWLKAALCISVLFCVRHRFFCR